MIRRPAHRAIAVVLLATAFGAPLRAAPVTDAQTDEDEEAPMQAPLTVGSMAIASDAALIIQAMSVDVAPDKVSYAYQLRNKGAAKLSLAASVAMPDLEFNDDTSTVYALPTKNAQNPVDLAVTSDDKAIATAAHTQAVALGIDRLAELQADHLPLVPFGPDIDKALAEAKPETLTKLASLGMVTPRDPSQPGAPVTADWSLRTVEGWMQPLEPNAVTNVAVTFTPIKATYEVDADNLAGFDAIRDQVCLTAPTMIAVKALLKGKDATVRVVDITLANDGPARWLDNPPATVAVRKPAASSVVVFCGMDGATANQPVVKGKMPGSNAAAGLRVLIFSAAGG